VPEATLDLTEPTEPLAVSVVAVVVGDTEDADEDDAADDEEDADDAADDEESADDEDDVSDDEETSDDDDDGEELDFVVELLQPAKTQVTTAKAITIENNFLIM
jgi:cobalamin biosynthesis protein CobT